jgi:hypothetical protein
LFADDPVYYKPIGSLEVLDRPLGERTENAVNRPRVVAELLQFLLQEPHVAATAAAP